jgi:asparagine synthase (glutamine-hydrolysing)
MCGLAAILDPTGSIELKATLFAMLGALAHRGPDGQGAHFSPNLALGHRLLAIQDAGATQPIFSEDGRIIAVVNGEFYGYLELKAELEARGHCFVTQSDSELLVHLFEEEGIACLHRLRGEFALILWDGQTLWAARDRFGVKPLCWTQYQGAVFLASEAKALLAAGVPASWSPEAFFQAFSLQYLLPTQTIFQHIHQLPPGGFLKISHGKAPELGRWWQPPVQAEPTTPAAFWVGLQKAVAERKRTAPGVKAAVQLSGGIDSGTIAALSRLPAFTVAFEEGPWDERVLAEACAHALELPLTIVEAPEALLLKTWPKAIVHAEGFSINTHLAAKYLLSQEVHKAGFKVLLSGEGADELLWGYAHLQADLGLSTGTLLQGIHLPHGPMLSIEVIQQKLGFVPTWLAAKASLGAKLRPLLHPDFLQGDPCAALLASCPQYSGLSHPEQSSRLWSQLCLSGYILKTLGDACELAHGVEGRVPFLETAELAYGLPEDWKIQGQESKRVLRAVTRGLLPEAVRLRPKHPFMAPPVTNRAWIQEVLHELVEQKLPFFNQGALKAMALQSDAAWDPALGMLVSAWALTEGYGL